MEKITYKCDGCGFECELTISDVDYRGLAVSFTYPKCLHAAERGFTWVPLKLTSFPHKLTDDEKARINF